MRKIEEPWKTHTAESMTDLHGPRDEAQRITDECWPRTIHALATGRIFEKKAARLRNYLNVLSYVSFLIPVLVGGLALAYGPNLKGLPQIIALASGLLIFQTVVSAWAVVAGWVDAQTYAAESTIDNVQLSRRYRELGDNPPQDLLELRRQYELLSADNRCRESQDYKRKVSDAENRAGHRYALWQLEVECQGCGKQPKSLRASICEVCGNFRMTPIGVFSKKVKGQDVVRTGEANGRPNTPPSE